MVKHTVIFKLGGTAEQRRATAERFKEALLALPEQIEVLQAMEVGININPAEECDVVLTATLPTLADVATYAQHPAHVAACQIIAGCKQMRACVDW